MSKKLIIVVSSVVVLVLGGAVIYLILHQLSPSNVSGIPAALPTISNDSMPGATSSEQASGNAPTIKVMEGATYEHDYSIDKYLMGESHNVFVAKITQQTQSVLREGFFPETHFQGEVVFNIKGSLSGSVAINQQAGYLNGVLYVPFEDYLSSADSNGGGHLLQPGFTYLLATRYNPKQNSYTLESVPYAVKLISENSSLSDTQLRDLAQDDERVRQLQKAYPMEVLSSSDVYKHTAYNSYQSLPEAQKAALPYYTGSYGKVATSTASSTATSTEL